MHDKIIHILYIYIYLFVYLYLCVYVYMYMYVCLYVCMYVYIYKSYQGYKIELCGMSYQRFRGTLEVFVLASALVAYSQIARAKLLPCQDEGGPGFR